MSITVADWEPDASKLPVYGQRVISSADWKYIIYEIYTRLNELKQAAACYASAVEPTERFTGMLWLDITDSFLPVLKVYVVDTWYSIALTEV